MLIPERHLHVQVQWIPLFDAPQYPADNLAPNRSTWNDFGLNRECGSGGADAKLALGRRRWSEGCVKLMISVPSLPGRAGSPRSTALRNRPSLLPNAAWMRERLSPVASVRSVMVVPSKLFSQKSRIAELIAWSSSKLRGRPFVTCSIYQINPLVDSTQLDMDKLPNRPVAAVFYQLCHQKSLLNDAEIEVAKQLTRAGRGRAAGSDLTPVLSIWSH